MGVEHQHRAIEIHGNLNPTIFLNTGEARCFIRTLSQKNSVTPARERVLRPWARSTVITQSINVEKLSFSTVRVKHRIRAFEIHDVSKSYDFLKRGEGEIYLLRLSRKNSVTPTRG